MENTNRDNLRKEELEFLAREQQKSPELFLQETFYDDPEYLKKFGIFIKGKENFPVGYTKFWAQDFIVEEIGKDGLPQTVDWADFFDSQKSFSDKNPAVYATLVKCGLSTIEAVEEIGAFLDIDANKIQIAGIKDKDALTSQLISMWNAPIDKIKKIDSPFFFFKNIYSGGGFMKTGGLKGNEFTILVRTDEHFNKEALQENLKKINENGFYNFFYTQRFGYLRRFINFYWAIFILKGEYETAVFDFLCSPAEREVPYFHKLREKIKENFGKWEDVEKIMEPFPILFENEMKVVVYLKENPEDFTGALNQIPEQVQLWLYAFSSLLFNKKISSFLEKNTEPPEKLPLVFDKDETVWESYKDILDACQIPDIKTVEKNLKPFSYIKWKKREVKTKEFAEIKNGKIIPEGLAIDFFLPKGCYATTFLAHFFNLVSGNLPKGMEQNQVDLKEIFNKGSNEKTIKKFKKNLRNKNEDILG